MTTSIHREGNTALATDTHSDEVAVLAEIRRRRFEFESLRHVPKDIVAKLQQIGCYRAFVPREFGGDALSPAEFCRLIERIATADASTGWVASFGVSAIYLAGLPPEKFAEIYGNDPNTVMAGALFPPQAAQADGDVLRVSGRWNYCSGVMGASIVGVGVKVDGWDDGGLPRVAILPRERVTVDENWDTIGLLATGSHDITLENARVPRSATFLRGGKSARDGAIFRYPATAIAAQVLGVVGLGTAREALDVLAEMACGDGSITGAPILAKRANVQAILARCEAMLAGARGYFYDSIENAWQTLLVGGELSQQQKIALRLATTNAAQTGAEVTRLAFLAGGTRAIVRNHPLGRCMNDAGAVAQHAFLAISTWESAGAAQLGQPVMPGYL